MQNAWNNNNTNRGYQQWNNQGSNSQNKPRFKRSGATFTICGARPNSQANKSRGFTMVTAWLKTKTGLVTFKGCGYQKTKGKTCEFEKALMTVTNQSTMSESKYPVLINTTTKRVTIEALNILITSKGAGRTSSGKNVKGSVLKLRK
jgi:hypothetical protein